MSEQFCRKCAQFEHPMLLQSTSETLERHRRIQTHTHTHTHTLKRIKCKTAISFINFTLTFIRMFICTS